MSENWWPTVALVHDEGGTTRVAVHGAHNPRMKHNWHYDERGIGRILAHPRHLALIDPEDREQVERLWAGWKAAGAYRAKGRESEAVDSMQAALREFANPARPKPEEPQGDGAVVEDASGHRWVRIAGSAVDSPPWRHRGHTARLWDNISAVRILSEGVQP